MTRSLIQLYALGVCFCTLMCFVVALGLALYGLVRIAWPAFTVQDSLVWQSDEHFLMYHPDKQELPKDQLANLREQYQRNSVEMERRAALQSLLMQTIILGIDVVVFAVHWVIARKREPQAASIRNQ